MNKGKKLGIWMDHANAHLIEFSNGDSEKTTITSKFTHQEKTHSQSRSENVMHNKEQHQQSDYYKKLAEVIKHYGEVVLFGPTDSKTELFNSLKDNQHFSKVKIEIRQADKMTENQQQAFVKQHFSKV